MKTILSLALVAAIIISGILAPQQEAHAFTFSETCGVTAKLNLVPSPNPTIWCEIMYANGTRHWVYHHILVYEVLDPSSRQTKDWGPGPVVGFASWPMGVHCSDLPFWLHADGTSFEYSAQFPWPIIATEIDSAQGNVGTNGPCT